MPGQFFDFGIFFNLLLEFICSYFVVDIFCEKRKYRKRLAGTGILVGMAAADYVVVMLLYSHMPIKMVFSFSIFFGCMCLIYDTKLLRVFVFTTMSYGLLACIDIIGIALVKYVFMSPQLDFKSQMSRDSMILAVLRIVLLAVILGMRLKVGKNKIDMIGKKEVAGLVVILAITVVSSAAICLHINDFEKANVPVSIAMGIMATDCILFFLINGMLQREKWIRESKIQQEKIRHELSMYYSISKNLDKQRKLTHEFKNHLFCISELAGKDKYDELKEYVGKINQRLTERVDMVDTNHVIVNAIINTKYQEALEKGILFVLKINDLSGLLLSDMDVVTILSNLLNNAFEACEQCEEKVIKLKFIMEKGNTVISVKNTMAKRPVQDNGIFSTTKMDEAEEHGIGIRNICGVLEKYNAKYQIEYDENEFSFSIVI